MNNVHYIVKAVESSEALSVVGQDWVERHKDLIEQYGEEYQASHIGLHACCGKIVSGDCGAVVVAAQPVLTCVCSCMWWVSSHGTAAFMHAILPRCCLYD